VSVYNQIDVFGDIIALDLGIIHPTVANAALHERPKGIDEALKSMTKDESLRCRRKFRKILKSLVNKKMVRRLSNLSKRHLVMMEIRQRAWHLVNKSNNYGLADNDE